MNHLNYVLGAYSGALAGSFFVHIFDTFATHQFARTRSQDVLGFIKVTLKSYLPVGLWLVPARSASFGVFSLFQPWFVALGVGYASMIVLSSVMSGMSLSVLSTPAELIKTRKQLNQSKMGVTFFELKENFVPLTCRIVPTVSMMLAGTHFIQGLLPIQNLILATSVSAMIAAGISQVFATPFENIRIYRISKGDYVTPTLALLKSLWESSFLYKGFCARALSLGFQAAFTLSAANSAASKL